MRDIAECGGRPLTIDKNYKRGTLIDALNLLAGSLPPGFIGDNLSDKAVTLAKIKADWTRNRRTQAQRT